MLAQGQVQHRVRRIEVGRARRAVGDPGHRDRAKHGVQVTLMVLFRMGAHHTVSAGHTLGQSLLATRPQVQVVLKQAAHQLSGTLSELILQLGMGQLTTTRIGKLRPDLLEQLPGPVKHVHPDLGQP